MCGTWPCSHAVGRIAGVCNIWHFFNIRTNFCPCFGGLQEKARSEGLGLRIRGLMRDNLLALMNLKSAIHTPLQPLQQPTCRPSPRLRRKQRGLLILIYDSEEGTAYLDISRCLMCRLAHVLRHGFGCPVLGDVCFNGQGRAILPERHWHCSAVP